MDGNPVSLCVRIRAAMGFAADTHSTPCEVQAAIGAGGMGEVYRARDMLPRERATHQVTVDRKISHYTMPV